MTTTQAAQRQKITYSAIGGDMEQIHGAFDEALARVRAGLGGRRQLYVMGAWADGAGTVLESRSPIDRDVLVGTFASASRGQIDDAVRAARSAARAWGRAPWRDRVAVMRRAAEQIRERRYEIAALMAIEVGKNRLESLGDAEESADLIDYYADQIEGHENYEHPLGKLVDNEQTRELLRPYGVFGVISPFNFPLALATGMTSAALLAGNTVVLKPSALATFTACALAECYHAAGMPPGAFNLVLGGGESVGDALVRHEHLDGLAFTGSHEVGMRLLREFGAGGGYAKPCLGELGGKNAAIVMPSADLDAAAEGVMRSAFGYGGQKCSACSRVYVDERVAGEFVERLLAHTATIAVGDPTHRDIWLGPVISASAADKFAARAAQGRTDGRVLAGGERLTDGALARGYFVQPTIVELPLEHGFFSEEMFLPLLAVGRVSSFEQALIEANKVPLGLTGGLFSRDETEIERFFNDAEAGVLYVNRRSGATTGAWPGVQSFCGWKGSGITGKGGCGPHYVTQFMREQSRTRML